MKTFLLILIISIALFITMWFISKRFPCPSWLGWLVEMENPLARENRSESIINRLSIEPNMTIADIGCGPGRVTIPLSKKITAPGKIVAIDLQPEMLERIKTNFSDLKNIELRQQDVCHELLESDYYDIILLVNVLGELPEPDKALQNIFQALKAGGTVSVTETIFDPHFQSKSKVTTLLKAHGFNNVKSFGPWYSYTMHANK